MSLINKMLRDLDERQGLGVEPKLAGAEPSLVKPSGHRGAVWVAIGVVACALGAAAWFGWQARPTKTVSPTAFQTPAVPAKNPPDPAAPELAMAEQAAPERAAPEPAAPEPAAAVAAAPQTPVDRPHAKKKSRAAPKPAPDAREVAAKAAEAQYQVATSLLKEGRVSEAEEALYRALQADSMHVGARQAYVGLLLEQRRIAPAKRLLTDALEHDPTQGAFALALARIHAEERDYPAALAVIDRAGSAASGTDLQYLRGVVLQRMGRHADAINAFEKSASNAAEQGRSWMGLAMSLDALGERPAAAEAYRRAIATGPLDEDLRNYAERRARALK